MKTGDKLRFGFRQVERRPVRLGKTTDEEDKKGNQREWIIKNKPIRKNPPDSSALSYDYILHPEAPYQHDDSQQ